MVERELPEPSPGELLLEVRACAVCRTDLHIVDGELSAPVLPLVPGHEIVGTVLRAGAATAGFSPGMRVGVPWLGWTCGTCAYCASDRENLCDRAVFTGYQRDGGYASHVTADARFCFPLPARYSDTEAAPLLCAGLIGYRALRAAGEARTIGLYGFGAAAHLACQVAVQRGVRVYAFTRAGDRAAQDLARDLGAAWAGASDEPPPAPLDAAVLFAPVGALVPVALRAVGKGGTVVCGGIHMSDLPPMPYSLLWGERCLRSVANLTRADARAFLSLANELKLRTEVTVFPLSQANEALELLRRSAMTGAAVLVP